MRKDEFRKCCQAIEEGEEILLENIGTHDTGRLLYCAEDRFQVRVGEQRQDWSPESCEELSSSSESPHRNL